MREIPFVNRFWSLQTQPNIHRAIIDELQVLRDQDPNEESNSELLSKLPGLLRTRLDLRDQEMQHLELRSCQGLPRERDRRQDLLAVLVVPKMWL